MKTRTSEPQPVILSDEPIYHYVDGVRYRWKRYSNRYFTSLCCFYLVLDPE